MLQRCKLSVGQLLSNPNHVRVILILSTMVLAALAGAAPNDHGGG
jgi:hypothetical protein